MHAWAHDIYSYPLPAGHRFPLPKYRLVREGAEAEPAIDVHPAPEATWEQLASSAGVNSTPTFFVGTKGKLGPLAVTALEVGQFTTALDKIVNAK